MEPGVSETPSSPGGAGLPLAPKRLPSFTPSGPSSGFLPTPARAFSPLLVGLTLPPLSDLHLGLPNPPGLDWPPYPVLPSCHCRGI